MTTGFLLYGIKMKEITVVLKKSLIGAERRRKEAVRCLGLRKIGSRRVFRDSPALRGQIRRSAGLVGIAEEAADSERTARQTEQGKTNKIHPS